MWCKNHEGYPDYTAEIAISRVIRKERKERKLAKRSCRRTENEDRIHEKAVKMRKMTDEQLVHYVDDRVAKARSEGFNLGKSQPSKPKYNIDSIIDEIGSIKGIGVTKLTEIKDVILRRLEVSNAGSTKTADRITE